MNTAMKLSRSLCSILFIVSINMAKALVCPKDMFFYSYDAHTWWRGNLLNIIFPHTNLILARLEIILENTLASFS
jgi:hypothetical protein